MDLAKTDFWKQSKYSKDSFRHRTKSLIYV